MMPEDQLLLVKLNKLFNTMPNSRDSQGRILRILSIHEGISQQKLQEIMGIKPGSLSELLQKLENLGYIRRETDAVDKRKRNLYITDAGDKAFIKIHEEHEIESRDFFDCLTQEDKDSLLAILNKLLEKHAPHEKHDKRKANRGSFEN